MNRKMNYLVIDVDGTMTDGGIYYDEHGNETKKFCTKDAAGYFACKQVGIKTIVITGRECRATTRRMEELKIDYVFQNIKDKSSFMKSFMESKKIDKEEIGYIGDDLNDYLSMKLVGFIACPNDACQEVKQIAHYISPINGGNGAVREIIEHLLRTTGEWTNAISEVYRIGV